MKTKLVKTVVSGALLAAAGVVNAAEPLVLSESQLDKVTAGGTAIVEALALARGMVIAATSTVTKATVVSLPAIHTQGGQLLPTISFGKAHAESISQ